MAGKAFTDALKKYDRTKKYTAADACKILPEIKISKKHDETVDAAVRLGVNPKHADQMVRGAAVLPHGTGKSKRVLVIAKGDKAKDAEAQEKSDEGVDPRIQPGAETAAGGEGDAPDGESAGPGGGEAAGIPNIVPTHAPSDEPANPPEDKAPQGPG